MCWLPQTIRIQQGYSQAFTNHDCRRPQEMGPRLTHPAVPSQNNWAASGKKLLAFLFWKSLILLKPHLLVKMWSQVFYTQKLTERKKSECNSGFEQGRRSTLGFSFGSKRNTSKAARLGSPRKAAALVLQCLVTIPTHLCGAPIGSIC